MRAMAARGYFWYLPLRAGRQSNGLMKGSHRDSVHLTVRYLVLVLLRLVALAYSNYILSKAALLVPEVKFCNPDFCRCHCRCPIRASLSGRTDHQKMVQGSSH